MENIYTSYSNNDIIISWQFWRNKNNIEISDNSRILKKISQKVYVISETGSRFVFDRIIQCGDPEIWKTLKNAEERARNHIGSKI